MVDSTRESFANLIENLEVNQIDVNDTPIVIQFNKRDIPGVLSVEKLQEALGFEGYPYTEASAIKGEGVMETFKLATKVCAKYLINKVSGKPLKKRGTVWEPPKQKPATAKRAAPAPVLLRMDDPLAAEPALEINPFASSMPMESLDDVASPFPDAERDYEKIEEVSLEQLLEGRERPATMSGNIAIPVIDEPEELPEEIEELEPAVAVMEPEDLVDEAEPADTGALVAEVAQLREEVDAMREEQRRIVESLQRVVKELTSLLRG